ncbi:MAG: S8 family peptidase, partial [bacterium JZ-2024 1]
QSVGNSNFRIVILDTGVDRSHPDLAGRLDPLGISCARAKIRKKGQIFWHVKCEIGLGYGTWGCPPFWQQCTVWSEPYRSHGTAMAGLAGAVTNNSSMMAGGSWAGIIYPIRFAHSYTVDKPDKPSITRESVIRALWLLYRSLTPNIYTLNMSFGFPFPNWSEHMVLSLLRQNRQTLPIASAGNDGNTACKFPACYPQVLAVAALRKSDSCRSGFSNYGYTRAAAYGERITTLKIGGIAETRGTSPAPPQVSALAHLLKSVYQDWLPGTITLRIMQTSDPYPSWCGENSLPKGKIDFCRAVWDDADWPQHCQ